MFVILSHLPCMKFVFGFKCRFARYSLSPTSSLPQGILHLVPLLDSRTTQFHQRDLTLFFPHMLTSNLFEPVYYRPHLQSYSFAICRVFNDAKLTDSPILSSSSFPFKDNVSLPPRLAPSHFSFTRASAILWCLAFQLLSFENQVEHPRCSTIISAPAAAIIE